MVTKLFKPVGDAVERATQSKTNLCLSGSHDLPDSFILLTPDEMRQREVMHTIKAVPVGAIFGIGLIIGFAIGIVICYQILFNEITDHMAQFATMMAMGCGPKDIRSILEDASVAITRGAPILAEIAGWGQSSDSHSVAQSDPQGAGLERAIHRALQDANVAVPEVDYVNAHATSTGVGDKAEVLALLRALGSHWPPVISTKGLTGHPLSMAGALETALATICL